MKKLFFKALLPIFILLFLFTSGSPKARAPVPFSAQPTLTATAETTSPPAAGDYACVLSEGVFFYSAPDERRGVFLLPKTYYVRLLEYGNDFCKIEYQRDENAVKRVVGYAKTAELTFVDYVPSRPYLYYVFDVYYTIEDGALLDSSFLTQITVSCSYYGDYRIGSGMYCYVLQGDEFGYIPKPASVSYEESTEYADRLAAQAPSESEENEPQTDEKNGEKSSPAQIAILVVVCLLVPVLAALVLKPPRRPPYQTED